MLQQLDTKIGIGPRQCRLCKQIHSKNRKQRAL